MKASTSVTPRIRLGVAAAAVAAVMEASVAVVGKCQALQKKCKRKDAANPRCKTLLGILLRSGGVNDVI